MRTGRVHWCIFTCRKRNGCGKWWKGDVCPCRYDSRGRFFFRGDDLDYKKCTLFITLLSFKGSQIEPKELAILKVEQILRV